MAQNPTKALRSPAVAIAHKTWPEETRNAMLAKVPMARWAQPGDISAVVAFLASNDAQYLTGGAYKVDGGSVVS